MNTLDDFYLDLADQVFDYCQVPRSGLATPRQRRSMARALEAVVEQWIEDAAEAARDGQRDDGGEA